MSSTTMVAGSSEAALTPLKIRKRSNGSSKKTSAKAASSVATDSSVKRPPSGKALAATDKVIRENAVEELIAFLSGKGATEQGADEADRNEVEQDWDDVKLPKAFRTEQMRILWQGCFYCMYMCDKPLPQQHLAVQLSEILITIQNNPKLKSKTARLKACTIYLESFWFTMVKEWPQVDKHRTDKYLSLMRKMIYYTFMVLQSSQWNEKAMSDISDIYTREGGPLYLQDIKTPTSIAYHIIDIYLEELEKAVSSRGSEEGAESQRSAPLVLLLHPFATTITLTSNKVHFQRILDNVFDPVLDGLMKDSEPASKKRRRMDVKPDTIPTVLAGQGEDTGKAVIKALFDSGASAETDAVTRKRLYMYAAKRGYEGDE